MHDNRHPTMVLYAHVCSTNEWSLCVQDSTVPAPSSPPPPTHTLHMKSFGLLCLLLLRIVDCCPLSPSPLQMELYPGLILPTECGFLQGLL